MRAPEVMPIKEPEQKTVAPKKMKAKKPTTLYDQEELF
jgi:hypothetical protein